MHLTKFLKLPFWNSIRAIICLAVNVRYVTSLHWSIMLAGLLFWLATSSIIHNHAINGGWSIFCIHCSQLSGKCFFRYTDKNVLVIYIKLFSFHIIKGYKKVALNLTANPETIALLIPKFKKKPTTYTPCEQPSCCLKVKCKS